MTPALAARRDLGLAGAGGWGWGVSEQHQDRVSGRPEPFFQAALQKELAYGRRDVERTVALLNAMKLEGDAFRSTSPGKSHERSQYH